MVEKIKEKKVEVIEPTIPDNCFVAKGSFMTLKGMVRLGEFVSLDDLIGDFIDLEKAGLA